MVKTFKPETILELGTCIGISAAYQAIAQRINGKGKIISLEGSPAIAELARKNLNKLNFSTEKADIRCGRFQDLLPDILKTNQPIDFAFIDGHHDESATIDYFNMILPFLSPKAVLIFDDISWSEGMKKAWEKMSSDKSVTITADLGVLGICIV